MPLNEHMYCAAVAFKVTKWVEQQMQSKICIKFCIKLEHSSMETIQMIQKATAMGNWWLADSSQQRTHLCITSCAEFFGEATKHPADSAPLQPRFGALQFLAFPKTKITFEMEGISDCWWDWRRYYWTAGGDWENCVKSQGVHFEGDWDIIVLCTMFLESCVFFSKWPYFSYYMAG